MTNGEVWDPFGTLRGALWIGGAQWAGKSTVARLLAQRHGITAYHYDYHDARGHHARRIADRLERGESPTDPSLESVWVDPTPQEMAATTIAGFAQRFEWALDDLRGLVSGRPILAEGWGLRPELVMPIIDRTDRMLVMVPTAEFRAHQLSVLPRAGTFSRQVSDPVRAQRNRLGRDLLVAQDAVRTAKRLGIRVLSVDGTRDAESVADLVSEHFGAYLPAIVPE